MAARTSKATRKGGMPDSWKDKSRVSALANLLADHAAGKRELSSTQIKSIEIILSKTVPNLSSIEQRTIDERDAIPENQIVSTLTSLVAASPNVIETLLRIIIQTDPGAIERVKLSQGQVEPDAAVGPILQ